MRDIFRSAELQAQFEQDGYVETPLLATADVARLVALHDQGLDGSPEPPVSISAVHADAGRRRVISAGIRDVLGPPLADLLIDCRLAMGNFFNKRPSLGQSGIHVHQDWSFVDETQHHSLTIWCPLENGGNDSGTLQVVPRSHLLPSRVRGFVSVFQYPHLEVDFCQRYSRAVTATPGSVVLFHQRLYHWSGPNRSPARRLAANCFAAPREASIFYPHIDLSHPDTVELFEADDELLSTFKIGVRPERARSLGVVQTPPHPLSQHDLVRILGAPDRGGRA